MQLVEDNYDFVQTREKSVASIVRSMTDLNEIFKDLAGMIVDQVSLDQSSIYFFMLSKVLPSSFFFLPNRTVCNLKKKLLRECFCFIN